MKDFFSHKKRLVFAQLKKLIDMKKLLLFLLPLAMISCSSDDSSPAVTENPEVANAITYINWTMNGQPLEYVYNGTQTTQALYNYASGYSGDGSPNYYHYAGYFVPYTNFTGPSISLGWNNMVVGTHATETESFPDAFSTVPTNFLTYNQSETNHMKGAEIVYHTGGTDDKYYSSKEGSQAGSTFTVICSESGTDDLTGLKTKIITGTFSCKLYNPDDETDVKTITGGTYKVIVREYN